MGQLRGWSRDSVRVASGAVRELRFRPTAAGAYYYTARIEGYSSDPRAEDSQLTGVIIVDAKGAHPRASDSIFAITSWGAPDSTTLSGLSGRGPNGLGHVFNGRAYPGNERVELTQGDSAHWTFVNLSRSDHPLHLHGFYFRVDARGDGHQDTLYSAGQRRMAVTEYMLPGETMAMSWSPNRSGNWIFHCHFAGHISPRSSLEADRTSMRAPVMNDMVNHMTGLVLGITVKPRGPRPRRPDAARNIRLIVRSQPNVYGKYVGYSFALGGSPEDSAAAVMRVPGPVLELTRGEPIAITIVDS